MIANMKYLSPLALISASIVSAEMLTKNFTINLLTQDDSLSITKFPAEGQTPISRPDAVIQHVYDRIIYSVVGSFVFNETGKAQSFHIDNDLWNVDIDMSLDKAGDDDNVMHQDVEVGKKDGSPWEFGFMQKPWQFPGVNLKMDQNNWKKADQPEDTAAATSAA